jgi:hypothetical protein
LNSFQEFLHFCGFYNEPTPTPKSTIDGKIICPICLDRFITQTDYEIHCAVYHKIKNGYDNIFYCKE